VEAQRPPEMETVRALSDEDRFVHIGQTDYCADWFKFCGAAIGADYWTHAEALITARQAGKVDRKTP
jgi:hypothetical protein